MTNGHFVHLDGNKRPNLEPNGLFTQNRNGHWKLMCSYETNFHIHGAKAANDVCLILGFSGSKFFNTTSFNNLNVPIDPSIATQENVFRKIDNDMAYNVHREDTMKLREDLLRHDSYTFMEKVIPVEKHCTTLYVECIPKSNKKKTIKVLRPGEEVIEVIKDIDFLKPIISPKNKPQVVLTPPLLDITKLKEESVKKIVEKIQNLTMLVNNKLHSAYECLHWPWLTEIYLNGVLHCVGILVDKNWVLVHRSCYNNVE